MEKKKKKSRKKGRKEGRKEGRETGRRQSPSLLTHYPCSHWKSSPSLTLQAEGQQHHCLCSQNSFDAATAATSTVALSASLLLLRCSLRVVPFQIHAKWIKSSKNLFESHIVKHAFGMISQEGLGAEYKYFEWTYLTVVLLFFLVILKPLIRINCLYSGAFFFNP